MRASALASEFLTYIPAAVIFVRLYGRESSMSKYDKAVALAAILLQPGLMLIDHGHFQYNAVMLGFTLMALDCFLTDHIYWGSFFFVLSLGFKQMALYYAPAVFAYLLGLCVWPRVNIVRLAALGATVVVSFGIVFAPLVVLGGWEQVGQCLYRVFPFSRGLWEDKVANFWCAGNVLVKFRERFEAGLLQKVRYVVLCYGFWGGDMLMRLVWLRLYLLFYRLVGFYSLTRRNGCSRLHYRLLRGGSFCFRSRFMRSRFCYH